MWQSGNPKLNYRICCPWKNVRYCLYTTVARRMYDIMKSRNKFIFGMKLFVQLDWRERWRNCEVQLFAQVWWGILVVNILCLKFNCTVLLKFIRLQLTVVWSFLWSCVHENCQHAIYDVKLNVSLIRTTSETLLFW